MAEGSGSTGILGVIVGVVLVLAVGFFLMNGNVFGGGSKGPSVTINTPSAPAAPSGGK